ncbi:hypothetical protein PHMEG_00019882 [Phytophthora megakarya]|uniref:Uncharacterized protein n=1 Tax=Phytophthora megakarya TaxID=4795 RepID=A0A225VQF4_9STRA|nr:hypothetical protein PHMEG_00019882 [Phytophthora megakarya]
MLTRYYTPAGWAQRRTARRGTNYYLGETELLQNVAEEGKLSFLQMETIVFIHGYSV